MSVDTKQALRLVLCLANPSRMQAARWKRAAFRGACAVPPESKRRKGRAVGCAATPLIPRYLQYVACRMHLAALALNFRNL